MKDIKQLRRQKHRNKEHIKKCVHAARQLRDTLRDIKPPLNEFQLHIDLNDGEPKLITKLLILDIKKLRIENGILKMTLLLPEGTLK
ncbi:MAG: hypothetical protein ACREAU_03015 [Nitrosopumilaceae archaeon]